MRMTYPLVLYVPPQRFARLAPLASLRLPVQAAQRFAIAFRTTVSLATATGAVVVNAVLGEPLVVFGWVVLAMVAVVVAAGVAQVAARALMADAVQEIVEAAFAHHVVDQESVRTGR